MTNGRRAGPAGVRGVTPLHTIAGLLVVGGAVGLWRRDPVAVTPAEAVPAEEAVAAPPPAPPTLTATEACRNVGYLCSELDQSDRIQLRRWKDFTGPLVVHVPRPDFEDPADATRLQQAAAMGLRAWNGQPFEISADLRGDRNPHFAVTWKPSLSGSQIGVARTRWSAPTGLQVIAIELTTRNPFDPTRVVDPAQVRLTAAHEMGHALGLPHSKATRDVMYPSNTATAMSAQDYRTMESLYRLPDGTEIVR
ncbi:MAG: matrixin family metalloprotease [Gemmatimonadales bacterium]